jgi:hypothetical protein
MSSLETAGLLAVIDDDATSSVEIYELLLAQPELCAGAAKELLDGWARAEAMSWVEADAGAMSWKSSQRDLRHLAQHRTGRLLELCADVGVERALATMFPVAHALT